MRRFTKKNILYLLPMVFFVLPVFVEAGCCFQVSNSGISGCFNATHVSQCANPSSFNPNDNCDDNQCAYNEANLGLNEFNQKTGANLEPFAPQVSIPGSEFIQGNIVNVVSLSDDKKKIYADLFPKYVRAIYQFGVWTAVVLSILMVMVGGFQWSVAGGSSERVSNAKSTVSHALVGVTLALFSYGMLVMLNPRTVNLDRLEIDLITAEAGSSKTTCCIIPIVNGGQPQNRVFISSAVKDCNDVSETWNNCSEYADFCCTIVRSQIGVASAVAYAVYSFTESCTMGQAPAECKAAGGNSWEGGCPSNFCENDTTVKHLPVDSSQAGSYKR